MFITISKTITKETIDRLAIGILGFALLIVTGLWLMVELQIKRELVDNIADIKRHNANLLRVFEEHTIRTIGGIDEILLTIKRHYESEGEAFDLPGLWSKFPINTDIIRNAIITDQSGIAILGSTPPPRISLADREHINVHFPPDSGQLFIGKTIQARIDGQWSIPMTRRANRPDGSLLGVVSVSVNPFYFSDLYKDVDLGRAGFVGLIGLDGIGRVRRAEGPVNLGIDLSRSELFKQLAIAPHGSYTSSTLFDGLDRIISYRTVRGYPLLVSLGVSKDEALTGITSAARNYRIFTALTSIAIMAFAAVLIAFSARARRHYLASEKTAAEMTAARDAAEIAGKFLRDITDNLPVLIAYIDIDRRIRFINKLGEIWYAKPVQDILGLPYDKLRQRPFSMDEAAFLQSLSKGPYIRTRTHKYPDGIVRDTESIIVPDIGPDGCLRGYYRLTTDVTERKRLDEQLRESQKMEAIGQLTGGIAHDFNNLLMITIGNLTVLSNSDILPAKLRAFVDTALRTSHRSADLTKHLLSFARRQPLLPVLTDLNDQVSEIVTLLRRTIPVTIAIDVMAHPMPVMSMVDANQLNTALLNLGLNARDAMKHCGLLVFLTSIEEFREADASGSNIVPVGRYAVIEVRDTGTGMSPEVMAKAFDPFFTTKPMGEGTGLGLSMVYGFVHQSGGYVRMSSTLGLGTTVKLLFPRAEDSI